MTVAPVVHFEKTEAIEVAQLLERVKSLEHRLAGLEEFVSELGDDLIDRTSPIDIRTES